MSNLLQPNGDDYPDAAEKHLRDADLLLQAGRFDGAGYLTGYVVECVLKTYILIEKPPITNRDLHHRLNDLSSSALPLAAISGAKTAKYPLVTTRGHCLYDSKTGWHETIRYRTTGTVTPQQANAWFAEAKAIYDSAIPPMKLDGLIN